MPNWVKNIVSIKGTAKDLKAIKELLFTEDDKDTTVFDFNKIIHMPESLDLESGSITDDAMKAFTKYGRRTFRSDEWIKETAEKYNKTSEELIDLGRRYYQNIIDYGSSTWYDWRIRNWGTKWNTTYPELTYESDNELCYEFQTAWSAPEPVYLELSRLYPDVEIDVSYADECYGQNCGTGCFTEGSGCLNDNEDFKFACSVWGVDPSEVEYD